MKGKRIILWGWVIAVTGMIFSFSAMKGPESMELSNGFTAWFMRLFYPDFESLPPEKQQQIYGLFVFIVRKAAHFSEFAALGMPLLLLLREYRLRRAAFWSWVIGTLYAGTDELHQYFNGTRTPSLRDAGIDSAGVLFGILVIMLLSDLLARMKAKKKGV